jgi:uncharacterized membrane protein YvbJ
MVALAAIWFFLKRVFWFVVDNWRIVLPAVVLLVAGVFVYRACNRPPKLDEKAVQRAQTAIATQDREEMTKVLVESDVNEKHIKDEAADAHAQTVNATEDAKKKAAAMTNEELAAELERRANQ